MSARRLLDRLQGLVPEARRGVIVLAYHLVGAGSDSPVDIPVAEFRRQMEALCERCRVVDLQSALAAGAGANGAEAPLVVLTFDDAYLNFRSVVWPILVASSLPATLYVPVAFVNGAGACPIRGGSFPACSWHDLRALASEGVAIGSHTVSHVNLARAPEPAVHRELRDSRDELEQRLGARVPSLCYPQAKWTRSVRRATRSYYESAVVAGGRRFVSGRDDPYAIPRFPVRRDLGSFESLLRAPIWLSEAAADIVRQRIP